MTFDYVARQEKVEKKSCPHKRERRRIFGFLLLSLAAGALIFDLVSIMQGRGLAYMSGIAHVWQGIHVLSYENFAAMVSNAMGIAVWEDMLQPLMKVPAVLLMGLPGFVLLCGNHREIEARAPSMHELELARMGLKPQRRGGR